MDLRTCRYLLSTETGARQSDAIALYLKNGYQPIPNYDYKGVDNSRVVLKKNVLDL
ncbi:MAG: hypothetical protein R2792_20330 [Saprospiraceae bacterium]